ncbi:hypothetical protein N7522_001529 [Penicillium canescens]|nr:hypothetical protein N7522_001529 [Penicillium canescens]
MASRAVALCVLHGESRRVALWPSVCFTASHGELRCGPLCASRRVTASRAVALCVLHGESRRVALWPSVCFTVSRGESQ